MTKVAQALCGNRHTLLGIYVESDYTTDVEALSGLRRVVETGVRHGIFRSACVKCGSTERLYEMAPPGNKFELESEAASAVASVLDARERFAAKRHLN